MPVTGRCLCGEVRYALDAELGPLVNCHCRFCRRAHGAAFATVTWVPRAALRFESGEASIREYRTPGVGARAFCERCGTRLYTRPESTPSHVSLMVASLDEEPEQGPIVHINVESKAPWYEILDELPRFDGIPPAFQKVMDD